MNPLPHLLTAIIWAYLSWPSWRPRIIRACVALSLGTSLACTVWMALQ